MSKFHLVTLGICLVVASHVTEAVGQNSVDFESARRLRDYFEQMSVAKPFTVRQGEDWTAHRRHPKTPKPQLDNNH